MLVIELRIASYFEEIPGSRYLFDVNKYSNFYIKFVGYLIEYLYTSK